MFSNWINVIKRNASAKTYTQGTEDFVFTAGKDMADVLSSS